MIKYTKSFDVPHVIFDGETEEATRLICPYCHKSFLHRDEEECPHCKSDITFPSWCDW